MELRGASDNRSALPLLRRRRRRSADLDQSVLLDPDDPGDPVPEPFLAAARDPKSWRLIAHNYEFERAILEHVLIPKHGFPSIPLEAQHCSMAVALANAYPAELETLAKALELPYQKDHEGLLLMRQMSRPRKPRKGEDKSVLHWVFDAEKLQRLDRLLRPGRSHFACGLAAIPSSSR